MKILMAGRANGLQVIDGPYVRVRDPDGLREYARRTQILGFDGKWSLHPDQVAILNEMFSPTQEQFDRAWEVLDAYREATEGERKGAVMLGDEMIDEASRKVAVTLVAKGERAGMTRRDRRARRDPRSDGAGGRRLDRPLRSRRPGAAQPGRPQPAHQLPAGDGHGPELDGPLAVVGGHVVVIALEDPAGQAQLRGEAMQLVVAVVADQMGPVPPPPRPPGLVDEDHGQILRPASCATPWRFRSAGGRPL